MSFVESCCDSSTNSCPDGRPVTSDVTRCGPGIATLTASDTATMHWYNAPIGGGLLETGSTFVTNYISKSDTVFYVEAGSVCPSPRIEAHVIINSTPDPQVSDNSRCGAGTVVLYGCFFSTCILV